MSQVSRFVIVGALVACFVTVSASFAAVSDATGGGLAHNEVQPSLGLTPLIAVGDGSTDISQAELEQLSEIVWFASDFAPRGYAIADGSLLNIVDNQPLFSRIGTIYGGDGETTFALPDLIGSTIIGTGQSREGTNYSLGQQVGANDLALTTAQIPTHNHFYPEGTTGDAGGDESHNNYQNSLALDFGVVNTGLFPSLTAPGGDGPSEVGSGEPALAELRAYAGATPAGYFDADGSTPPIELNTALFSLMGTNYGGDGRSTFGMPDLQGASAMHEGSGTGLTTRSLGSFVGTETETLDISEIAAHTHGTYYGDTASTGGDGAHNNMQPSVAVNYIIALVGIFPSEGDGALPGGPYVGEIRLFLGNFAPRGWAFLDGQLLSIASNQALFSLISDAYGGDGINTFALPDLRGRIPVGALGDTRFVPGLTAPLFDTSIVSPGLATAFGHETETLTVGQLPSHVHDVVPAPAALPAGLAAMLMLAARRRRRA